jgi:hypothetical protein
VVYRNAHRNTCLTSHFSRVGEAWEETPETPGRTPLVQRLLHLSALDATPASPHACPAEFLDYREALPGVYQFTNDCKFNLKAQTGFLF